MSVLAIIGAVFGGGTLGVIAKSQRDKYVARMKREEHAERIAAKAHAREDDITRETAIEDREDRRRMEQRVADLSETVTRLSVDVARCEERHAASEERERELTVALGLAQQLLDRQRAEIESMSAQLDDLRTKFDALVRRAMTEAT